MIFQPERTPAAIVADYPAHVHMNLLPRLQDKGVGARLLASWMSVAQGRGVKAIHVGVNRANGKAIRFWRRRNFQEIPTGQPERRTLWMGLSLDSNGLLFAKENAVAGRPLRFLFCVEEFY